MGGRAPFFPHRPCRPPGAPCLLSASKCRIRRPVAAPRARSGQSVWWRPGCSRDAPLCLIPVCPVLFSLSLRRPSVMDSLQFLDADDLLPRCECLVHSIVYKSHEKEKKTQRTWLPEPLTHPRAPLLPNPVWCNAGPCLCLCDVTFFAFPVRRPISKKDKPLKLCSPKGISF